MVGTRAASKKILKEAERLRCDAIVMGADPPKHPFLGRLHLVAGAVPGAPPRA